MGVRARRTLSNQALDQGRVEIGPVAGAIKGEVDGQRLDPLRPARP